MRNNKYNWIFAFHRHIPILDGEPVAIKLWSEKLADAQGVETASKLGWVEVAVTDLVASFKFSNCSTTWQNDRASVRLSYRLRPEDNLGEIEVDQEVGFNCSKCVKSGDVNADDFESPKFQTGEIDRALAKIILIICHDLNIGSASNNRKQAVMEKLKAASQNPFLIKSGKFEDVSGTPWECGSGHELHNDYCQKCHLNAKAIRSSMKKIANESTQPDASDAGIKMLTWMLVHKKTKFDQDAAQKYVDKSRDNFVAEIATTNHENKCAIL